MIKLISIDLFETLVDLSGDRHFLWQKFMGDDASLKQTEDAWDYTGQLVYQTLDQINIQAIYQPLATVFQECFKTAFNNLNVEFDPKKASQEVITYHASRPWFPEAESWLADMKHQCLLCLSSDTDDAMMGDHVRQYPFDKHFTSEGLGCYKGDEQNRFFETIINNYEFDTEEILHVGDSSSEILAANRVGIQTCWINRNGQAWSKDQSPDYEVSSLDQIAGIIKN